MRHICLSDECCFHTRLEFEGWRWSGTRILFNYTFCFGYVEINLFPDLRSFSFRIGLCWQCPRLYSQLCKFFIRAVYAPLLRWMRFRLITTTTPWTYFEIFSRVVSIYNSKRFSPKEVVSLNANQWISWRKGTEPVWQCSRFVNSYRISTVE